MKALQSYKQIPVLSLALLAIPAWGGDLAAPGVPNFHQVNEHIYRGAQPTNEGWQSLAKLGVKTVIDLRREDEYSANTEARAVEAAGMRYVNVPMNGILPPEDEDISKVLALLDSGKPTFVHCKQGKDRTGTVIACYRMLYDHWQNNKALKEAESYGMHWFEIGMKHYIQNYQTSSEGAAAGPVRAVAN
jgi:protein tyrosine/serine phosphatase